MPQLTEGQVNHELSVTLSSHLRGSPPVCLHAPFTLIPALLLVKQDRDSSERAACFSLMKVYLGAGTIYASSLSLSFCQGYY
jgi:hypothetical protein